jgi:hypothetical protein
MHNQTRLAPKFIAACAASTLPAAVFAHEGHGMLSSHWHATDVFGFVVLACALGLTWWFFRNRD